MNKDKKPSVEIEVTPAMIEAGVSAFRANETEDPNPRQVRLAVTEIFEAMSLVGRRQS
jgi:hypothetical protein